MTDYTKLSAGEFLQKVGMDARKWAEAFIQVSPPIDEGTMIGWFANAIEAGRDHGDREVSLKLEACQQHIDKLHATTIVHIDPEIRDVVEKLTNSGLREGIDFNVVYEE